MQWTPGQGKVCGLQPPWHGLHICCTMFMTAYYSISLYMLVSQCKILQFAH